MYQDKTLTCADCGATFVYTADLQELHAKKGYTHEPRRCEACRDSRKKKFDSGSGGGAGNRRSFGSKRFHETTCAQCGGLARVPFEPKWNRPVYCRDCFSKMQESTEK